MPSSTRYDSIQFIRSKVCRYFLLFRSIVVFFFFWNRVYEEEMTLQSGIYESSNLDSESRETPREEPPKTPLKEVLKKIYEHLQQIHDTYQKRTFKEKHNNEWLLVASLVDRMLFIAYCFVIVLSVFTILKNNWKKRLEQQKISFYRNFLSTFIFFLLLIDWNFH